MPDENLLVLVADDEPSMREMVADHLRQIETPRLDVIVAENGEQALSMARERLPDLVVLDVMMPEMSGWEVCKRIREDISLAHTAVLMLTGIGEKVNELTSPLYGADAHIDKPFEFEDLDDKVRETLAARASQRGSDSAHERDERRSDARGSWSGEGQGEGEAQGRRSEEEGEEGRAEEAEGRAEEEEGAGQEEGGRQGQEEGAREEDREEGEKARKALKRCAPRCTDCAARCSRKVAGSSRGA